MYHDLKTKLFILSPSKTVQEVVYDELGLGLGDISDDIVMRISSVKPVP